MFARILVKSLIRRKLRKSLALVAIWVGLSLILGFLVLGLDVGDRMNRELSSLGANIILEPIATSVPVRFGGYDFTKAQPTDGLAEQDLHQLKTIFWRNNILGAVPRLWGRADIGSREVPLLGAWIEHAIPVEGEDPFVTGMRSVFGNWLIAGTWPAGSRDALLGIRLSEQLGAAPGEDIRLEIDGSDVAFHVTGIVATGQREDEAVIARLKTVQRLTGHPGRISEALVMALTTPENRLAEKYRLDPAQLTPAEYERWVCTPYPGSVAANIAEAIPGSAARVVRRVAETQGVVLTRIQGLMLLLAGLTLVACALSILGVLTSSVLQRRPEVALLAAIGATRGDVLLLFLSEAGILGLAGGTLAAITGPLIGRWLLRTVFQTSGGLNPALVILTPLLGVAVAVAANLWPVRRILQTEPASILHGD